MIRDGILFFRTLPVGMQMLGMTPYHLLHLKIEVEKNRFLASVEECRARLGRRWLVPQESMRHQEAQGIASQESAIAKKKIISDACVWVLKTLR